MVEGSYHFSVLGPLNVELDGRRVGPGPEASKPCLLMTVLVLNANHVLSKDALVSALWSAPPETARNLVEKYVSQWRKVLEPDRLQTVGQGYRLRLEESECDLLSNRHEVGLGRDALKTRDYPAAATHLGRAMGSWRDGLESLTRSAVPDLERERLIELYLGTLEDWAHATLALGSTASDLIDLLAAAQRHDPLRERLTELLMWALTQQGRQAEALACFEDVRRRLDEELGQQPGSALSAMHLRVLRQDVTLMAQPRAEAQRIVHLPPRNRRFAGRDVELERLSLRLKAIQDDAPLSALAVWGLIGAGKSALVLEFVHRVAEEYDCVWWVDAGTRGSCAAGLEMLAGHLQCEVPVDREEGWDYLWTALERRDRWLLIFDDVGSSEDLAAYWPRPTNGVVLITSLNPDWSELAEPVPLGVLSAGESAALLARTEAHPDPAALSELAAVLGHHPLALAQAAAYMEQTGMSVHQYLPMLLRRRSQLLDRGVPRDHTGTIDASWRLASAELTVANVAATQLLGLASYMAPERIPLELFRQGRAHLPAELRIAVEDEVGLEDAIRQSRRFSLLSRDGDEVAMHVLVQDVVFRSLTNADREGFQQCVSRLLCGFAPVTVDARSDWRRWETLAPHVLAFAARYSETDETRTEFISLLRRTSEYFCARGSFGEACTVLRAALEIAERSVDEEGEQVVGQVLTELGTALEQNGSYRDALAAQERALSVLQSHDGPDSPWVARALGGLGSVLTCHRGITLWRIDETDEAVARLEHALDVLGPALGPLDPTVARTLAARGQVRQDRGDLTAAQGDMEDAVAILTQVYGDDHPEVIKTQDKLAYVLALRGDFTRSEELHRHTVTALEEFYGEKSLEVGWPLSNLGMVYLAKGELPQALETQRRVHAIFASIDPGGAVEQIAAWRVAKVQLAMGRPSEAVETLTPAVARLAQILDAGHPDVIGMQADLALARSAAQEPSA